MHKNHLRTLLIGASAAAVLSACGGGGGDSAPVVTPPVARTTDVPDSAIANPDSLVAYIKTLFGMTSETSEPIVIGDVVLPTDDTAQPAPVN